MKAFLILAVLAVCGCGQPMAPCAVHDQRLILQGVTVDTVVLHITVCE